MNQHLLTICTEEVQHLVKYYIHDYFQYRKNVQFVLYIKVTEVSLHHKKALKAKTTDKYKDLNYKNRLSLQGIPATIYKNRASSCEKFYLYSLVYKVCYRYCTVCHFKTWGTF